MLSVGLIKILTNLLHNALGRGSWQVPVVLGNGQPASQLQRRTPKILRRRVSCRCERRGLGGSPS